jgi:hypothetical protein
MSKDARMAFTIFSVMSLLAGFDRTQGVWVQYLSA